MTGYSQFLFKNFACNNGNYLIFHDESEPKPNRGWLLIGLLFVAADKEKDVLHVLQRARQKEAYNGEIHFCELPKSFDGKYGAKARVAQRWLEAYENDLYESAMFSCLAVNRASPSFNYSHFSQNYHIYNRFTAMAIKAGIAWLLQPKNHNLITLTVISDEKNRKSRPEQGIIDNFEEYIPQKVEFENWLEREIKGKPYPKVTMKPIRPLQSHEHDLLQLTDLLLGAIQCALTGTAIRETKRKLASRVLSWINDLEKEPWKQTYRMHRRFNVWGFPNEDRQPFNKLPWKMNIKEEYGQLPLLI